MKTYMANAQTVERKWYVVDAAGVPLGRLASRVASVLRGKNKPTFTPTSIRAISSSSSTPIKWS